MPFKKKVSGTPEFPVMVYYKKEMVKGKLANSGDSRYFLAENGDKYPVLLTGEGIWMTVITENRFDRNILR